jgi:hypothetical protein
MRFVLVSFMFSIPFLVGCQTEKRSFRMVDDSNVSSRDVAVTIISEPQPAREPGAMAGYGFADAQTDDGAVYQIPLYLKWKYKIGDRITTRVNLVPLNMHNNIRFQFMGIIPSRQ